MFDQGFLKRVSEDVVSSDSNSKRSALSESAYTLNSHLHSPAVYDEHYAAVNSSMRNFGGGGFEDEPTGSGDDIIGDGLPAFLDGDDAWGDFQAPEPSDMAVEADWIGSPAIKLDDLMQRQEHDYREDTDDPADALDGEYLDVELSGQRSKYRGVSFDKKKRKWRVQIKVASLGRSGVSVGYYDTEVEAARAYDRAAIGLLGLQATNSTLNFGAEDYQDDSIPTLTGKSREEVKATLKLERAKAPRDRKAPRHRTSSYLGVGSSNRQNQWQARILYQGKVTHLGYYNSEIEAARVYDRVTFALNGSSAQTNFPEAETVDAGPGGLTGLTREEVQRSLGVKPMDKSSQFRGVSKKKGKWEAKVMVNRKWAYREMFDAELQAARAYDDAVWRLKPREAASYINFKTEAESPRQHSDSLLRDINSVPPFMMKEEGSPGSILPGIQKTMRHSHSSVNFGQEHLQQRGGMSSSRSSMGLQYNPAGPTLSQCPSAFPQTSQCLTGSGQRGITKSISVSSLMAHTTLSDACMDPMDQHHPSSPNWYLSQRYQQQLQHLHQQAHCTSPAASPSVGMGGDNLNAASLLLRDSTSQSGYPIQPPTTQSQEDASSAAMMYGFWRNDDDLGATVPTTQQPSNLTHLPPPHHLQHQLDQELHHISRHVSRIASAPNLDAMSSYPTTTRSTRTSLNPLPAQQQKQQRQHKHHQNPPQTSTPSPPTKATPNTRPKPTVTVRATSSRRSASRNVKPEPVPSDLEDKPAENAKAQTPEAEHAERLKVQQALLLQQERLHEQMRQHQAQHMEQQKRTLQRQQELELRNSAQQLTGTPLLPHGPGGLHGMHGVGGLMLDYCDHQTAACTASATTSGHGSMGMEALAPASGRLTRKAAGRTSAQGGSRRGSGVGRGDSAARGAVGKISRTPSEPHNMHQLSRLHEQEQHRQSEREAHMRKVQSMQDLSRCDSEMHTPALRMPSFPPETKTSPSIPTFSSAPLHNIKEEEVPHRDSTPTSHLLDVPYTAYDAELFDLMSDFSATNTTRNINTMSDPYRNQSDSHLVPVDELRGHFGSTQAGDSVGQAPEDSGMNLMDDLLTEDAFLLSDKPDFGDISDFVDVFMSPSHSTH